MSNEANRMHPDDRDPETPLSRYRVDNAREDPTYFAKLKDALACAANEKREGYPSTVSDLRTRLVVADTSGISERR